MTRAALVLIVAACSSPARQPPPQPPQGHYVEFGVVEESGGPPGTRTGDADAPQPAPAPVPAAGPPRSGPPAGAGTFAASKPPKAYKGPEGAVVVMVEVDDGKQMLVHFRNIDRGIDGKTLLYRLEDLGDGNKTVYVDKKRGSKTNRSILLTARDGWWQFYHPYKSGVQFDLAYSESESRNLNLDDVLSTYNPEQEPSR